MTPAQEAVLRDVLFTVFPDPIADDYLRWIQNYRLVKWALAQQHMYVHESDVAGGIVFDNAADCCSGCGVRAGRAHMNGCHVVCLYVALGDLRGAAMLATAERFARAENTRRNNNLARAVP